jgi:hypothetical protein
LSVSAAPGRNRQGTGTGHFKTSEVVIDERHRPEANANAICGPNRLRSRHLLRLFLVVAPGDAWAKLRISLRHKLRRIV